MLHLSSYSVGTRSIENKHKKSLTTFAIVKNMGRPLPMRSKTTSRKYLLS